MTADRYDRQSFLGRDSRRILEGTRVGIVGLGGGGSHVIQQLAHLGVKQFRLFDADLVDMTNLNRLIGATYKDIEIRTPKVLIAKRTVDSLVPDAEVRIYQSIWQKAAHQVKETDVLISCVDSFAARQDIESTARRFLIPLIDIGMDVFRSGDKHHIAGQVIVSLPGAPCMRCLGFLNDRNLRQEAELYGAAGGRPQVVWANGVLASIAVGLFVDLMTGWNGLSERGEYLHFDGNSHIVSRSPRLEYAPATCQHFPDDSIGDPTFH